MDHNRLKGRPPFPFDTIAWLSLFPRTWARCSARQTGSDIPLKRTLLLIYIGEHTPATENRLHQMCQKTGIDQQVRIISPGGDPVGSLLGVCKENMVDLLVLGALRRETVFRYYLGSVARDLSRRAKCSLLLLTEPEEWRKQIRHDCDRLC